MMLGKDDEARNAGTAQLGKQGGSGQAPAGPTLDALTRRFQGALETGVRLIKKHFETEAVEVGMDDDPEGDGAWLVLRFDARGGVPEALRRYRSCMAEWGDTAPPDAQNAIRFLYNILDL
jgi:hypothetical protein